MSAKYVIVSASHGRCDFGHARVGLSDEGGVDAEDTALMPYSEWTSLREEGDMDGQWLSVANNVCHAIISAIPPIALNPSLGLCCP